MKTIILSIIAFLILFVMSYLVLPEDRDAAIMIASTNSSANNQVITNNNLNRSDFK